MSVLPEPLTTPDVDTERLDGFMLNTVKLLGSTLMAISSGDQFKAAVTLWCRAWKERPAASLPDDDVILAAFSGYGSKWPKVKAMALRGFIKCSDGRLYHPELAKDAIRAHKAATQRRNAIAARYGKDSDRTTVDPTAVERPKPTRTIDKPPTVLPETGRDGTYPPKEQALSSEGETAPVRAASRATRLPSDWKPGEDLRGWTTTELIQAGVPLVDALDWTERTVATFRDYWLAKPGKGATKLDWNATWRIWVKRSVDEGKIPARRPIASNGHAAEPPADPQLTESIRRFMAADKAWRDAGCIGDAPRREDFGLEPRQTRAA